MREAQPHFIAILPRAGLQSQILDCKAKVQTAVGDQLFLTDPPHLTVFLASFQDRNLLCDTLLELSTALFSPVIRTEGWHVFEHDCLTGNNTLVIKINDSDKDMLRQFQSKVVERTAELRDKKASLSRYQTAWQSLSPERRQAVQQFGFPFVGSDWQPHFTIASIRPSGWERIWNQLKNQPIIGSFEDFELALFALDSNEPNRIATFALKTHKGRTG